MKWVKPDIPEEMIDKWQKNADLMAAVIGVPAGLIMKIYPLEVEVFLASATPDNPYKKGQRFSLDIGLYNETVIAQRSQLLIPDARRDPQWERSPDVALGMISYLGLPLMWPDGEMFGIICVLDKKENHYLPVHQKLIWQIKNSIDADLNLLLKIAEHKRAKEALEKLKAELDARVETRTAELKKAEEKYRHLVEKEKDIIYAVDEEGIYTWINPAVETILGYKPEELIGKRFSVMIPQEWQEKAETDFRKLLEVGEITAEIAVFDKEGQIHFIEHNSTVIKEVGKIVGARGIIRDITERKKVEDSLRESGERLKYILDSIPVGIVIIDPTTHTIVDANPAAIQMIEAPKGRVIGAVCHRFICPPKKGHCPITDHNLKIYNSENTLLKASGQSIPVLKTVVPVTLKDKEYLLEIFIDIAKSKKAEQALRENEERFRLVASATFDAIWDWDLVTNEVVWNEGLKTLFGYSEKEAGLDANWRKERIHPEDRERVVTGIHGVIDSGQERWSDEYRFLRRDGSYAFVIDRGYVLHDEKGKAVRMIGAIMDVTERKKAEAELIQAQKLASIGQLAAGVAHEINNPLSAISGEIQWLLKRNKEKKLAKSLQLMDKLCNRIAHIVNNLLVFSRETSTKVKESSNVDSLIEKTLLLIGRRLAANNIKITKKLKENLPEIFVNRGEIEQALMNIFLNSLDAMPHGGKLSISTRLSRDKEAIEITIADTGAGIAKKDLPRVFEPFFTTKAPGRGAGLGLYLSHGIIKKHNGSIAIDSKLNKGTKISIRLPLTKHPRKTK